MFLDNFFILFPETFSMFWYLVIAPFRFYSAQDWYDLCTKNESLLMT